MRSHLVAAPPQRKAAPAARVNRIADRASGEAPQVLRRACVGCGEREETEEKEPAPLQRSPAAAGAQSPAVAPDPLRATLSAPGRPLAPALRESMQAAFAFDFSSVRIHDDTAAADTARTVGARAYTVGPHVVFGPGEYEPGHARGRWLLAHELAHVVQQGAHADLDRAIVVGDAATGAEAEAERAAGRAAAGLPAPVGRGPRGAALLQRFLCTDLIASSSGFIEERLVQRAVAAIDPRLQREYRIPSGSFTPYRDKRPPAPDPMAPPASRAGEGRADAALALKDGGTLELAELKRATLEEHGLIEGEGQLRNYVEKAKAPYNRDWRKQRGIKRVVPMPVNRFELPRPLMVDAGGRKTPVRVGWCDPGLLGFRAGGEDDEETFACIGRDQGRIDRFINNAIGRAEQELDRYIDGTVDRVLTKAIRELSLRMLIMRVLRSAAGRRVVERILGPGTGVLVEQLPVERLATLIEEQISEEGRRIIRRVALDLKAQLLARVRQRLREGLRARLEQGLNALCAGATAVSLARLLRWLRENLPRFFEEAAAAVVVEVALEVAREMLAELGRALLTVLLVILAAVAVVFAIVEIAGAIAAAGIGAAIEAAIEAIILGIGRLVFAAAPVSTGTAVAAAAGPQEVPDEGGELA